MFTIRHIRTMLTTSLGLQMSGVKWEKPLETSSSSDLSLSVFNNKTVEQRNELLKNANPEQRNALLKKIEALKGGTEQNRKWRESMKQEIQRLNSLTPLSRVDIPESPKVVAVQAGAAESTIASPEGEKLTQSQARENKDAVVNRDKRNETVGVQTRQETAKVAKAVEKTIAHKDNDPINIEFDDKGNLKKEALVDLLSDLDGMSGVERANRGWFRRTFFGGGDQKEVIGEQQLKIMLSGKSKDEINKIYMRITDDQTGLDIKKENVKQDSITQSSRFDFDHQTQSKITKFQTDLIQQVDVVATLSSILLKDKDARTGLRAVLEGKTGDLETALKDPAKMAQFQETLKKNGVLDRDPSFLEKAASILLRIGISAGFSILSGGVLGGYIEQGKLDAKNGKVNRDGLNLTAKKGVGEEGSASIGASADLAGVRLEGNWNDPEMRIANRVAYVMDAKDKMDASLKLITKINSQYNAGSRAANAPKLSEKEQSQADTIANLGDAFLRSQKQLLDLSDSQAKTDALTQNTLTYLSKVEKVKGAQLKGVFAAANLSGAFIGLSGSSVDTSASSDKLKVGAGTIEGEALGAEKLSDAQVAKKLQELGIVKEGNTYKQDGKDVITVPTDKKVQWKFQEVVTDRDTIIRATPTLIDINAKAKSEFIPLSRKNVEAKSDYIQTNSQNVSDLMHRLRQTDARTSTLQMAISEGNYDGAAHLLGAMLEKSKDKTAKDLRAAMLMLKTDSEKSDFFDLLLSKTSGGKMSLELAKKIDSGKDASNDVREYYKKLAKAFSGQYGISEAEVQNQVNSITNTGVDKAHIAVLGEKFKDGFTGVVAFSQINKGNRFATLDKIINSNARMIGLPNEVTDKASADTIREKIKSKITPAEVTDFKQKNKALEGKSDDVIKSLMVAGKVSSYLSYEESAQCFNLGFVAEPGKLEQMIPPENSDSTGIRGTTVGKPETNTLNFGAGAGATWDTLLGKDKGSNGGNQGPASDPNKGGGKIDSTQLPTGDQ